MRHGALCRIARLCLKTNIIVFKKMFRFFIITPAFNEAAYIEQTIQSVLAQTIKPLVWVIVDDGSTDDTANIVKRYAVEHPWIHYVYREKDPAQTYYASNVYAIRHGISHIQNSKFKIQNYDFLAILDADIKLPSDYYEKILTRMHSDSKLGIASGVYVDNLGQGRIRKVLNDRRSTPKALMVFKNKCFEDIDGFVPMKYGYEDTVACFAARMNGWKTWSFPDVVAVHNKPVGTGHASGMLKIRFRLGMGDYFLGSHVLFVLLKSFKRCFKESPFLIGGCARFLGYCYGFFHHDNRQVPTELVEYIRKEQIKRILTFNKVSVL